MGQYYLGYVKKGDKVKVFDNRVDGEWTGLKLMEHSYWGNTYVGQVINELFYSKGHVCWVGDYYSEDDYSQVNAEKDVVKTIGDYTWNDNTKQTKSFKRKTRTLGDCLLVNHTKKVYINGNEFYAKNKWLETWEDESYYMCINPLPLLTCSASHSGGSYHGINKEDCGTWFNDELEVVLEWEDYKLNKLGYKKVEYEFRE